MVVVVVVVVASIAWKEAAVLVMLVSKEEVSSLPWLWAAWALSSWTSAGQSVAG